MLAAKGDSEWCHSPSSFHMLSSKHHAHKVDGLLRWEMLFKQQVRVVAKVLQRR